MFFVEWGGVFVGAFVAHVERMGPPKVGVTPGEVVFTLGSSGASAGEREGETGGSGEATPCCWLELSNKGGTAVAFKVKTTSPKRYSVKPNAGTCGASGTVRIKVTLSPQASSQAAQEGGDAKVDKFLIQTVHVPRGFFKADVDEGQQPDVTSLFHKGVDAGQMTELKLRAKIVVGPGGAGARAARTGAGAGSTGAGAGGSGDAEAKAGATAVAVAAAKKNNTVGLLIHLAVLLVAAALALALSGRGIPAPVQRLLQRPPP